MLIVGKYEPNIRTYSAQPVINTFTKPLMKFTTHKAIL